MTPASSKPQALSRQPTETALRVLAGRQTIEDAAKEHGVSTDEVESWCNLLRAGASHAASKRKRLAGLLAAGLLLMGGVTVAVAAPTPCPDPTLPLPAPLKKFCPDEPASGKDLTDNFTQMITWINLKVGPVDKPLPDNWIYSHQIADGAINESHLPVGPVVTGSQISSGSLLGEDVQVGAVEASRFAPGELVPIYEINPNCAFTGLNLSAGATCIPDLCPSNSCGPALIAFKSCTDGCSQFTCSTNTPWPTCNNTLRGYALAP